MNSLQRRLLVACVALAACASLHAAEPAAPSVLVDYSHEWPGSPAPIIYTMSYMHIGVTSNYAYLYSVRKRLADYRLVVLWQHMTAIPYDELDYGCLLEYVKSGGRVLFVSNVPTWTIVNHADSPRDYPLLRFAHRFGLKLNCPYEELDIGRGKVIHQDFASAPWQMMPSRKADERRPAEESIAKIMGVPAPAVAERSDTIDPEIPLKEGGFTLLYALPVKEGGAWARKAVPRICATFRESFGVAPGGVVLRGIASSYSNIVPNMERDVPLLGNENDRVYALAATMLSQWLQPSEGRVYYPRWIDAAWPECFARDVLKRYGISGRYALRERQNADFFQQRDPNKNAIDLAQPRPAPNKDDTGAIAYDGKADYVYRALLREQGSTLIVRFRDLVHLYVEAGKVPNSLDSQQTVRLLSLAAGKDLFPWFRSTGMKVEPLPLDFAEADRLRAERAKAANPGP